MFNFFKKKKEVLSTTDSRLSEQEPEVSDYPQTDLELVLLNEFISPKYVDKVLAYWPQELKISVLPKLIANQDLIQPKLEERINIAHKASELKEFLRNAGLPISGAKPILIERLITNNVFIGEVSKNIYECSSASKKRVVHWIEARGIAERETVIKVINLLKDKNIAEAYLLVKEFKKTHPNKGAFRDANNPIGIQLSSDSIINQIRGILSAKPKMLSFLCNDDLERVKLSSALMEIGFSGSSVIDIPLEGYIGTSRFPPSKIRILIMSHAQSLINLEALTRYGVKEFEIVAPSRWCCVNCAKYDGKILKISDLPENPNPNCLLSYDAQIPCMGFIFKAIHDFES